MPVCSMCARLGLGPSLDRVLAKMGGGEGAWSSVVSSVSGATRCSSRTSAWA